MESGEYGAAVVDKPAFWGPLKTGDIFLVYLIVYPLGRFWLEFLRLDSSRLGGVNANQAFMVVVMMAAALILGWRHWLKYKVQTTTVRKAGE